MTNFSAQQAARKILVETFQYAASQYDRETWGIKLYLFSKKLGKLANGSPVVIQQMVEQFAATYLYGGKSCPASRSYGTYTGQRIADAMDRS